MDLIYGAAHGIDIPFLFGHWDRSIYSCGWTEENEKGRVRLSEAMRAYLSNFARTGDPNSRSIRTKWQKWSNDSSGPKRLILDANNEAAVIAMSSAKYDRAALLGELAASPAPVQFVVNAVLAGF
jgi:para-nitrobenzyl esterase